MSAAAKRDEAASRAGGGHGGRGTGTTAEADARRAWKKPRFLRGFFQYPKNSTPFKSTSLSVSFLSE